MIDPKDVALILDDLEQAYYGEGYEVLESAPDDVIDAYKRLRKETSDG